MSNLYHYCKSESCFKILSGKSIHLSEITKSNDSQELNIFFPDIFRAIDHAYCCNPFPFEYEHKKDYEALQALLDTTYNILDDQFENGTFTNYVLCFTELSNDLGQWREYADHAKGFCLGLDKEILEEYCRKTRNLLKLVKVKYISVEQKELIVQKLAHGCLKDLSDLRKWIVDNMTHDNTDPHTDGLLGFNFHGLLESIFTESLRYKSVYFKDEKEWRLYFQYPINQKPEWLYNNPSSKMRGPEGFNEMIQFMKDKIDFYFIRDDIISFFPIRFDELERIPITEVIVGPQNFSSRSDLEMFLYKYGYHNTKVIQSEITYR